MNIIEILKLFFKKILLLWYLFFFPCTEELCIFSHKSGMYLFLFCKGISGSRTNLFTSYLPGPRMLLVDLLDFGNLRIFHSEL